jgi:REP-associated tyrosine transposase
MPRKPRPTAAGVYHVAARASAGERLFRDEHDYLRFETELAAALAAWSCRCIGACALSTHYHVLLETTVDGVLPQLMKRLNQGYAASYNARYARRGHAFADRYLAVPVVTDEQLATVYRYLAHNPVEAGVCAAPHDWAWSSYPTAIGRGTRFAFADPALAVAVCGGSIARLRRFVEAEPNSGV